MLALSRRRGCEARQESLAGSQMLETLRDSPLICSVIGGEQKMDWNRVEGNWKQVRGKIKEEWGKLTDDDLDAKCVTPGGVELRVGKWLRSMIEHEVHHRGQIYMYLAMLGVETPPMYGLTEEEVRRRSTG